MSSSDASAYVGAGERSLSYPAEISGDRAIVTGRDVTPFDESLSNVGAKVRDQLRIEMLRMQREIGFTAARPLGLRVAGQGVRFVDVGACGPGVSLFCRLGH